MALIYQPGDDPSRVYYGTDTRAFALLIGAAFAIACPSCKLSKQISLKKNFLLDLIGLAGLLGIILTIWKTSEYDNSLYTGGLAFFSVLSAVVVVILAHPSSIMAKFMGCRPLRWIGVRSYSLYLWHYPVIILTTPTVDTGGFNGSRTLLQLVLSFLLAVISWNFIEKPIRCGSFTRLWRDMRTLRTQFSRRYLLVFVMTPLFLFVNSCSSPLNRGNKALTAIPAAVGNEPADTPAAATGKLPSPAVVSKEPVPGVPEHGTAEGTVEENSNEQATTPQTIPGEGITAIGDSVILDAAPYLTGLLPGINIDGKVGRQMYQAQEVLDRLKAEGKLGYCVIIELGTNGSFDINQLTRLISSLKAVQQVILVNVRVPRKWQDKVNSDLQTVAGKLINVTVVDWFSASKGKDSFFYSDGVHLKAEGAQYYASLISKTIERER
jgi:hypothetical protein